MAWPGQVLCGRTHVALGEVTTLDHEVLDDTVEPRALISEALLTGSESA